MKPDRPANGESLMYARAVVNDCGFSIHVGSGGVDPDVVWAKRGSLAQGAAIATGDFGADTFVAPFDAV